MTQDDRMRDRIRWGCRRGMLELDLVLTKFVERHLARLEPPKVAAFKALLARTDPELLDLVMGHTDAIEPVEREVLALVREEKTGDRPRFSTAKTWSVPGFSRADC